MNSHILLTCIFLSLSLFACKKKEADPAPTKTAMLTSKTWKVKSININGTSIPRDCMKDDVYSFYKDGKFILTDAGVECDPPGNDTGTWSFAGNETLLVLDSDTSKIEEFTAISLKTSLVIEDGKIELSLIAQ